MNLLVLPIVVPLGTAAIMLFAPKRILAQRWIANETKQGIGKGDQGVGAIARCVHNVRNSSAPRTS